MEEINDDKSILIELKAHFKDLSPEIIEKLYQENNKDISKTIDILIENVNLLNLYDKENKNKKNEMIEENSEDSEDDFYLFKDEDEKEKNIDNKNKIEKEKEEEQKNTDKKFDDDFYFLKDEKEKKENSDNKNNIGKEKEEEQEKKDKKIDNNFYLFKDEDEKDEENNDNKNKIEKEEEQEKADNKIDDNILKFLIELAPFNTSEEIQHKMKYFNYDIDKVISSLLGDDSNSNISEEKDISHSNYVDKKRNKYSKYERKTKKFDEKKVLEFIEKNKNKNRIDLHGFHLSESMFIVKNKLEIMEKIVKKTKGKKFLIIVTGRGKHSPRNKPVLRPNILRYLKSRNYNVKEGDPGALYVVFN